MFASKACFGQKRATSFLAWLAMGLCMFAPALWAQDKATPPPPSREYAGSSSRTAPWANFDIRRFRALRGKDKQAVAKRAAESHSAGQHAIQAFRASTGAAPHEIQGRANSFGLPKVLSGVGRALSPARKGDAERIARDFIADQRGLFPFSRSELSGMRLVSRSEHRGVTFLHYQQRVGGVGVHDGYLGVTVSAKGEVLQVSAREAAPGLRVNAKAEITAPQALRTVLRKHGASNTAARPMGKSIGESALYTNPFGSDLLPIAVRPEVFVMGHAEGRLSYRMVVQQGVSEAYELVVDATDGSLLQRRSLVDFGQGRVYKQTPVKGGRELVEFPEGDLRWLDIGARTTAGNNALVFVDRRGLEGPNSEPAEAHLDNGAPIGSGGMFDFPAGEGATTGQDPRMFGAAAATNLFYFLNVAHDYFYGLGFDEDDGNFQIRNLDRGGKGGDRVEGRAQDPTRTNNASMFTPEDGMSAVMRMGLFSQGTFDLDDDRDASFSDQVVIHEYAHGVTNRRVGGPQQVRCLDGVQSAAMGEGWSDYFAISITNDPVVGGYLLPVEEAGGEGGIRRASYQSYPFTYADVGNDGYQVHRDGEIWAATLWDARNALGAAVMDQLVYDGLGFTPCKPSMVEARDAILMADAEFNNSANAAVLWEVFAAHGLGASAAGEDGGFEGDTLIPTVHTAAFDLPAEFSEDNRPPAVTSTPDTHLAARGVLWTYQIQATDPEGGAITYEVVEGPTGVSVSNSGLVSWTPEFMDERIVVRVGDSGGASVFHGFELPLMGSVVSIGDSFPITGRRGSVGFAAIEIPDGVDILQLKLRGDSGDADLAVFQPPTFQPLTSLRNQSVETMTFAAPAGPVWVVSVMTFEPFENVQFSVQSLQPVPIGLGSTISGLSGDRTSETFYSVNVPEATGRLVVNTTGGMGDMDLMSGFVRAPVCQWEQPSIVGAPCEYEQVSRGADDNESLDIKDPAPGRWIFNLFGFEAYDGVSLSATTEPEDTSRPRISRSPETGTVGILNAASFQPALSPGSLATLFGQTRESATLGANALPLPRALGGLRLYVNHVPAPLLFGNGGQVNFQIPFETAPGKAEFILEHNGVSSAMQVALVQNDAPGMFGLDNTSADPAPNTPGDVIATRPDGSLVTGATPIKPGETLILYVTGLSSLSHRPETGAAATADPLARVSVEDVGVILASTSGGPFDLAFPRVDFAGLSPGFVGLGQVNITIPPSISLNGRVAITIFVRGAVSQTGYLPFTAGN